MALLLRAMLTLLLCVTAAAPAEAAPYPSIGRLAASDLVFKQLGDSIAQGYRAEKAGDTYPDLFFCVWHAMEGDDLFSLAARLSLPYEAISTLNGLEKPRSFKPGEEVLVPSVAGVFVPDTPRNDMDIILSARAYDDERAVERVVVSIDGAERSFTFWKGGRLYQTERSFFLVTGFRMPLPEGVVTSGYGWRKSPIDGHDRMHEGVDLAAPAGTAVMAARGGTVSYVGTNAALGLFVTIAHEGGIVSVYGHLQRAQVVLNEVVRSGTIIGTVGSSGLSTGPHLHFEIRLGGSARDPSVYVPGLKQ